MDCHIIKFAFVPLFSISHTNIGLYFLGESVDDLQSVKERVSCSKMSLFLTVVKARSK